MSKSLFIAEKPSVAREFGKALKENLKNHDGYMESDSYIVTWCVGHLVTMSYPDAYDEKYKKWSLDTLPFLPEEFKYEVIETSRKQYDIVAGLLHREDVETIYVCTDSGREGEYIYRLVEQMAGVKGKERRRVWIDSQTEEEILRGIKDAKDLSAYDHLSDAAYLRAKEDYLMGINFSRLLSLRYSRSMASFLHQKYCHISVGRVMTCVLGMIVEREREIRNFKKEAFYRVLANTKMDDATLAMEWKAVRGSAYENSPLLYKENGFKEKDSAKQLIADIFSKNVSELSFDENEIAQGEAKATIHNVEKKTEKKNPPMLYNLAELQNDCSKFFKISPDETLAIVQELYEKKLVTYPRTDARVLSTAVAKEIDKNIRGLKSIPGLASFVDIILAGDSYKKIAKTKYTNDSQITDHYAIIPTGQGISALKSMSARGVNVYEIICRRFLAIFYPAAQYTKLNLSIQSGGEYFFATERYLKSPGYLEVMKYSFQKKKTEKSVEEIDNEDANANVDMASIMSKLKKGDEVTITSMQIKEGETSPPKRYNSGAMILAMENAGQLIEDEELRAQIKSSGIGTSATRAEILKKLVSNKYIYLNKKTQIYSPTLQGEMVYDVVACSIPSMLNPKLTASWEKGLTMVANGEITSEEYMTKLENFITQKTTRVKQTNNQNEMQKYYRYDAQFYKR